MSNEDVPLGDGGRSYYAQRFGSRLQTLRKYDAPPPPSKGGGAGGVVGGLVAIVVVAVIIGGAITGGSHSSSSTSYSPAYNYTPPLDTPQVNFDDAEFRETMRQIEEQQRQQEARRIDEILHPRGAWPQDLPPLPPDDPVILPPPPPEDEKLPGRDD